VPKILVLYHSHLGNTEKTSNAAANGTRSVARTNVEPNYYVPEERLSDDDAILVGTPTYHHKIPGTLQ